MLPVQQALDDLETNVNQALASGDQSGLTILGYGEISTVLGLVTQEGRFACKRLPLFNSPTSLEAYRACFESYLLRLREQGIRPIESQLQTVALSGGRLAVYGIQPMLPAEDLAVQVMGRSTQAEAVGLFASLVDRIKLAVSPKLGMDAQLSNWALCDGQLLYFDVTTPLMRDESGQELLDVGLFMASLPWAVRGLTRKFMLKEILDKYYDPRGAVLDLLGNLYKEQLERFLPSLLDHANRKFEEPFTMKEIQSYYRADAKNWALLQRLRRMDRFWQRRIRRRPYPFLLPGKIIR